MGFMLGGAFGLFMSSVGDKTTEAKWEFDRS
jgi:hypothetical protein